MHNPYAAARGKRSLDPCSNQDCEPDRKRPALASVIVEALKLDSLQKLCSSLEPVLRRVVSEEVERALAKLGPAKLNGRVSPKRIEAPNGRNLQLQFESKLSLPLFTGGKVEGEQGAAIQVVLLDANTGRVVTSGPESSLKLDVVVLEGDFNNEDDEGWTQEEFESHTVKEREGKRPLLTGDLQVALKNGRGTLGDLSFTDNSSWIRSRKFRLGLKVASSNPEGFQIREAKTDAFPVRDHRGELYKKHYPPSPNDEVWRLEKIGKDGSFHKKLEGAGIRTVEDFLRLVMKDQQKLRSILGPGMSNKMWDVLVEHAKTCVLSGKHYIYYPDGTRQVGAIFNDNCEFTGLISGGQYHSVESLDAHKDFVDALVKKAYENWSHVIEYDGKSLLGFDQNKSTDVSQNAARIQTQDLSNTFDQLTLPSPSVPITAQHHQPMNSGLMTIAGFNENTGSRYPMQLQNMNLHAAVELPGTSLPTQNQMIHSHSVQQSQASGSSDSLLALGPPVPTMPSFPPASNNTSNFTDDHGGYDDIPMDEIRARSHEMLESYDLQQLLRMHSMGGGNGQHSFNGNDDFGFSPYNPFSPPNFNLDYERTRSSSGKAVVSWLKLKAVMRWGIFVRNKAAERRARIEELDENQY